MKHNNIIKLCLGIFLAFTMALPAIAQKTQTFKGVVVDTTGEPIILYRGKEIRGYLRDYEYELSVCTQFDASRIDKIA